MGEAKREVHRVPGLLCGRRGKGQSPSDLQAFGCQAGVGGGDLAPSVSVSQRALCDGIQRVAFLDHA